MMGWLEDWGERHITLIAYKADWEDNESRGSRGLRRLYKKLYDLLNVMVGLSE